MMRKKRGLVAAGVWSAWALSLAGVIGTACGSEDSSRQPRSRPEAGAGGEDALGSAGEGQAPVGGVDGGATAGAGGSPEPGAAGAAGVGGTSDSAGAAGAAGAPPDCESFDPVALEGVWKSTCNGYTCHMYIAASGELSNGCTNGQYESGAVESNGDVDTLGEGGNFNPYSTNGTFSRNGCDALTRDYIGQIPPNTGPELSYSCAMTRVPACASSLVAALVGDWNGKCGSSTETCLTTFTAEGEMSSTCSNGQSSTGAIDETGAFSDVGSGGAFPAYSTSGVVALDSCDTFLMAYTWQSPPNQGKKTSQTCVYTRAQ